MHTTGLLTNVRRGQILTEISCTESKELLRLTKANRGRGAGSLDMLKSRIYSLAQFTSFICVHFPDVTPLVSVTAISTVSFSFDSVIDAKLY